MDRFMMNDHTIHAISSLHECCLRGLNNMVSRRIKPIGCGFSGNLKANIKKTNKSILLYHL
jgi:hypothetical protein